MLRIGTLGLLAATAVLFLPLSSAHYTFKNVILYNPLLNTSDATRLPKDYWPNIDFTGNDIRCNIPNKPAGLTLPVEAGSNVSFAMLGIDVMYHPGPATMYLGKVPEGETAATWDGSGKQWFKIKNWGGSGDPNPKAAEPMWYFETYYENTLTATVPAEVPSGEYLLRVEHIGLHTAPRPEFFVSCAQIKVLNGGNGNPPMVEIPGHIDPNDPSLRVFVYKPIPGQTYRVPGPDVWVP